MSYKVALIFTKRLRPDAPDPDLEYKEFIGITYEEARLQMMIYIKEIANRVFRRGVGKYIVINGPDFERGGGTSDVFEEIDRLKNIIARRIQIKEVKETEESLIPLPDSEVEKNLTVDQGALKNET